MIFPGTSAERREGKKEAFMAENKKFVITVGRQYGSGGAEMAKRLGERLGLHVYDKEILKMTSEESGIRESYFHLADEKAGNKLLYRIIHSLIPENGTPSLGADLISSDNLFRFQSSVIRKLAQEESCIIIGRCSNLILRNAGIPSLDIFLHADVNLRTEHIQKLGLNGKEDPRKYLTKMDNLRETYFKTYTKHELGTYHDYDLCLDTGTLGYDNCIEIITSLAKQQGLNLKHQ